MRPIQAGMLESGLTLVDLQTDSDSGKQKNDLTVGDQPEAGNSAEQFVDTSQQTTTSSHALKDTCLGDLVHIDPTNMITVDSSSDTTNSLHLNNTLSSAISSHCSSSLQLHTHSTHSTTSHESTALNDHIHLTSSSTVPHQGSTSLQLPSTTMLTNASNNLDSIGNTSLEDSSVPSSSVLHLDSAASLPITTKDHSHAHTQTSHPQTHTHPHVQPHSSHTRVPSHAQCHTHDQPHIQTHSKKHGHLHVQSNLPHTTQPHSQTHPQQQSHIDTRPHENTTHAAH